MTRRTVYLAAIHILLLLVCSAYLVNIFVNNTQNDYADCYNTTAVFHKRVDGNTLPGRTLFIGDSLVQGLAVNAITDSAVNFGIGLDTVADVATRLLQYQTTRSAKQVFIAVGINDILSGNVDEAIADYNDLVAELPVSLQLVVSAVLPVDEDFEYLIGVNANILRFNTALEQLARQYSNLQLAGSITEFYDANGNLRENLHIGDGLHLNVQGYELWISELRKLIM